MKTAFHTERPMNPLLPPEYCIPDVEARSMPDGRLYLYGSHDVSDKEYCSRDYAVFSTEDFQSWTMEAPSFRCEDISWAGTLGLNRALDEAKRFDDLPLYLKKMIPGAGKLVPIKLLVKSIRDNSPGLQPETVTLFAPDAIEKDGEYYLFFCLSDGSEGVAVSDSPNGPFTEPVALPTLGIDPSVFRDDDGKVYLFWDQFSSRAVELNPDLKSFDEAKVKSGLVTEEEHHFHEGSSVRKRGDTYYYVFADTSRKNRPTCLGYATAKHPLGPYTYQGVIIDNLGCDPETWNNHGCIQEYKGQWYVFYHRSSRNSKFHRRVCCEPIFFDENGLIAEVKMTSQGPGPAFAPGEIIPAYAACEVNGGAYVDGDRLVLKRNGSACFRYLQGSDKNAILHVEGDEDALVHLLYDGLELGTVKLKSGTGIAEIRLPGEEWELTLKNENEKTIFLRNLWLEDLN